MRVILLLAIALISVCCSTEDSVPNQRVYESVNAQPVKPHPNKVISHE